MSKILLTSSLKEKDIEKAILNYLTMIGWFAWKNPDSRAYDRKRGTFLQPKSVYSITGISDIICIKNSQVLFIEVKRPGNKQTPNQIIFEKNIEKYGGKYLVAKSIKDVEAYLKENKL